MASNGWDFLSALAWPVGIGGIALVFRGQVTRLVGSFVDKFDRAHEVQIGSVSLIGAVIAPSDGHIVSLPTGFDKSNYTKRLADKSEWAKIRDTYNTTRSLMFVHKIKPSVERGQKYSVSLYIAPKNWMDPKPPVSAGYMTADLTDVDYVEYYLGSYFGGGEDGSWFAVHTPDNGFAMSTTCYGPPLCIARIHFKDGEVGETYRFVDFEMGEVFDAGRKT